MDGWIEKLARLGYASKGAVYIVVGLLTLTNTTADRQDAFRVVMRQPFGRTLLIVIALGLAGYAVWRVISGFDDSENRGSDAKGLAIRAGSVLRGLLYGGIAGEVVRMAARRGSGGSGGDAQARHWVAEAMDKPFGRWAVIAAGVGVLGYGIYQLLRAWKAKLGKQLRLDSIGAKVRGKVVAVSRFGIGARGVVFGVVGFSLIRAAIRHDPQAARGTSGALRQIASQPFGGALLIAIAVGLIAYGIYALINAKYRIIRT